MGMGIHRSKTSPASTPGSFSPRRRSEASQGLHDPNAIDVFDGPWEEHEGDTVGADDPFGNPGASTWRGSGFGSFEAGRWAASGIVSPETAAEFRSMGVTPEQLSRTYITRPAVGGEPPETISFGRAVEQGDISPGDVPRLLRDDPTPRPAGPAQPSIG